MCDIFLRKPTINDEDIVMQFRQEFIDNNEINKMNGSNNLNSFNNYINWFKNTQKSEILNSEFKVPSSQFLTIRKSDNSLIGMVNIRHTLNDIIKFRGGHVGDCIRPSERNKGYGSKQIKLALSECKKLHLQKILITCSKHNIASIKTITKNGGILENEAVDKNGEIFRRYWINLNNVN